MKHTYSDARSAIIIGRLVKYFRVLKGWRITTCKSDRHKRRCWINNKRRSGTIYLWHGRPPKDFELHEVLHFVLAALTRMDRRKPKELDAAEETVVCDLCALIFPEVTIQASRKPGLRPARRTRGR